jgi:predicted 3-demethylubiquinone-9 3-methyltransferase (glyoxalase superfamily)
LIGWPALGGYFDLDSLDGKGLRESLVALLNHAAIQHRNFAVAVNTMLERESIQRMQTIVPTMWFHDQAEEAANYYVSIFGNSPYPIGRSIIEHVFRDGDESSEKKRVVAVTFFLEEQKFIAVNGDTKHQVATSNAFTLHCTSSPEIEYFTQKLLDGGQNAGGGWIKDKFGVSWNFGPGGIDELLSNTASMERSGGR